MEGTAVYYVGLCILYTYYVNHTLSASLGWWVGVAALTREPGSSPAPSARPRSDQGSHVAKAISSSHRPCARETLSSSGDDHQLWDSGTR